MRARPAGAARAAGARLPPAEIWLRRRPRRNARLCRHGAPLVLTTSEIPPMPPRPSTYSIVACDLEAAEWGVAVQSKFLAVGAGVPAAEPQVGAIATQALANMRYGPDGLAILRQGLSAEEVVQRLTEADEGRADRQLGVV